MRRVLAVLVSLSCIWFFGCSKDVEVDTAGMQDRLNAKIAEMDHLTERSSANCSMQGMFVSNSLWIYVDLDVDTDDEAIRNELIEQAGRDILEVVTTTESAVQAQGDLESYRVKIVAYAPSKELKEIRLVDTDGSTLVARLTERFGA